MKKIIKIFPPMFLAFFLLSNCKEIIPKKREHKKARTGSSTINETSIIKKDNVFEISQTFVEKDSKGNIVSEPIDLNLTVTSGAMLSAYSEYNNSYVVSFRTFENSTWTNWTELLENKEVNNPNRKAFSPKNLNNTVKKMQFKSNSPTNSKVIFRIFTFKK